MIADDANLAGCDSLGRMYSIRAEMTKEVEKKFGYFAMNRLHMA